MAETSNSFKNFFTPAKITGELTGYSPLKRSFARPFAKVKSLASDTFHLFYDDFKSWNNSFGIPQDLNDDAKRFEFALQASGAANEIDAMQASAARRAQYMAVAIVCMLAIGFAGLKKYGLVYNLIVGPHGTPFAALLPFAISLLFLGKFIQWSFWSFQLRHRSLSSFFKFLRAPSEWLPPDMPGGRFAGFLLMAATGGAMAQHTGLGIDRAMAQVANQAGQTLSSLAGQGGAIGSVTGSSVFQSLMGNLSAGDLSMQWMTNLFPTVFSASSGVSYQQDAIAQMLQAVNTTLIGLGAVLLIWHTVSGVVSTAHDGQVLGRKWHTIYAPMRISLGVAATAPIKGYCAAQLIALQVIIAGCGLANLAWTSYVDAATGATNQIMSVTVPPQTLDQLTLFNDVVSKAVCVTDSKYVFVPPGDHNPPASIQQVQQQTASSETAGIPTFADPSVNSGNNISGTQQTWNFGAACGSISYPAPGASLVSMPGSTGVAMHVPTQSQNIVTTALTNGGQAFIQARNQAFDKFVGQVMSSNYVIDLASSYVAGGTDKTANLASDLATVRSDYSQYQNAVLTAAEKYQSTVSGKALQAVAIEANSLGWASAGALEPQILQANVQVDSMLDQKPTITSGNIGIASSKQFATLYNTTKEENNQVENLLMYALPSTGIGLSTSTTNGTIQNKSQLLEAIKGNPSNMMNYMGQYTGSMLENYANSATNLNPLDPIGEISSTGMYVKGIGYSIITIYAGFSAANQSILSAAKATQQASNDIPVGGIFTSAIAGMGRVAAAAAKMALMAIAPYIDTFAMWLIAIGAIMEYIIPMIGYIMWVTAIMVYIMFVIELVLGSAFWAFAHIRADGDELVGREQGYGYSAFMVALFYPILMTIGLIFANVAIAAVFTFINETFLMGTSMIGAVYDPVGIVVILSVKAYLYMQIIIRAYRLISAVPEWVFQYIGANARRDDSFGHGMGDAREAMGRTRNIIGSGAKPVQNAIASGFSRGSGGPR